MKIKINSAIENSIPPATDCDKRVMFLSKVGDLNFSIFNLYAA